MRAALSACVGFTAFGLALGGCGRPAAAPVAAPSSHAGAEGEPSVRLELPLRRSPASPLATPPDVPAALASPVELTLSLERRAPNGAGRLLRETIARGAD